MDFKVFACLAFFSFLLAGGSYAQLHPILDEFKGLKNKNRIELAWVIKEGSTCNGIKIYRSADSAFTDAVQIGFIEGICGSVSEARAYRFIDSFPLHNLINYYRLQLGLQGYSGFVQVGFFKVNSKGYLIRPHPVASEAVIHFENSLELTHTFYLYDLKGNLLRQIPGIREDSFSFYVNSLPAGAYLFVIEGANGAYTRGKIVLQ